MELSKGRLAGVGGPGDGRGRGGAARSGRGATPQRPANPPDPFEDIAAPPLRTGRPPERRLVPLRPAAVEDGAAAPGAASVAPTRPEAVASAPMEPEVAAEAPTGPDGVAEVPAEPATVARAGAAGRGNDLRGRPAPAVDLVRPVAPARRASGGAQLLAAVVTGLVLALTMVALAVHFRPAPGSVDAAAEGTVAPEPAPPAAELAPPTPATPVGEARVRLRFGPGLPEEDRTALREAVLAAGFAGADLSPLPFPVDRERIEYHRPADRAAAEALAAALAPVSGTVELRDLSATDSAAEPGRIDAWLAN